MQEERHIGADRARCPHNGRMIGLDSPQMRSTDKRRRRIGRPATETRLARDMLLNAYLHDLIAYSETADSQLAQIGRAHV